MHSNDFPPNAHGPTEMTNSSGNGFGALLADSRQGQWHGQGGDIELETIQTSRQSFAKSPKGYHIIDDDRMSNDNPVRGKQSDESQKKNTWITGPLLCSAGVATALIAHLILTVKTATEAASRGYQWGGPSSIFYEGHCDKVNQIATGLHFLINIIALVLVAASSYCCQVLAAPSRARIDQAHARRVWVSIGASSFTNIWFAPWWRKSFWLLLLGTSIPIQVIYNSFIYVSVDSFDYGLAVAPLDFVDPSTDVSSFLVPSDFKTVMGMSVESLHQDIVNGKFERLEPPACFHAYDRAYQTNQRTLVALSPGFSGNMSAWTCYSGQSRDGVTTGSVNPYVGCGVQVIDGKYSIYHAIDITKFSYTPSGWPIEYCLSKAVSPVCGLGSSLPIGLVVLGCIAVKLLCILCAAFERRTDVFLTVGDALASFLRRADPYTVANCLMSGSNRGQYNPNDPYSHRYQWVSMFSQTTAFRQYESPQPQPKKVNQTRRRWATALPSPLLVFVIVVKVVIISGSIIVFKSFTARVTEFMTTLSEQNMSTWQKTIDSFFHPKFRQLNNSSFLAIVLLVNTPQVIITIIYTIYNNVLTRMLLAAEYNDFAIERKPLRVSFPTGKQRSTYYLSIPYRYSIPFMVLFTLAHWIASQALSYIQIIPQNIHGDPVPARLIHGFGLSTLGMKLTVVPWLLTVVVIGLFMLRKFRSAAMPLALNCSAAISAACHPPLDDVDAAEKPVMWGQVDVPARVPDGRGVPQFEPMSSHCSFTSQEVTEPDSKLMYY